MLNIKANIPAFYLPLIYMITSSTYSILCSKHKKLFSIWCYILRCWASKLLVAKRKWIICQSIMDIGTRPKFSTTHTPPPILCLLLWLMLCPMHDSLPYQNTFYNYRLKNRATKCTNGDESKKKKTLDSLYFCFNYTLLHCLNTHVEGKKTRIMEEKVFLPCVPIVFASQCKKTKNNR